MIRVLPFLFGLLASLPVFATNYYLSLAGNDANNGTSTSSPWQSISKLNTATFSPGDSVFFRCNDTFRGQINVNQGGDSGNSVVFTSYGTGSAPIISGAEVVNNWTTSGNHYVASYSGNVVNFFVDGIEQTVARYPNEQVYLTLDSARTNYLKDASLSGINVNLVNGSKVCVHSSQWSWEKASVTAMAGDKISYGSTMLDAIDNYGYFLYDNINHIDTAHEWKHDATNHQLHYFPQSGSDPNTHNCEVSVTNYGISLGNNVSNIVVSGLNFQRQSGAGIYIGSSTNQALTIENCSFSGQYNYGIDVRGLYVGISNCSFRDISGMAVFVHGTDAGNTTIDHNDFVRIGVTRANGLGGQLNGTALMCSADNNHFHHNTIDSTGYCGISADGAYNLVERNVIDHAMLIENDGAGIKGWGAGTTNSIYQNNFITNSNGNTEGTYQANFITPAIYFDFNVNNCTISENTVYNHGKKGIFQNSANFNNTIKGNVIWGGNILMDFNGSNLAPNAVPITGMIVKHNQFFSKDNNSVIIRQVDYSNNYNTGVLDSNYYFQPYNIHRYALRMNGMSPVYYTFSEWQTTGNDPNTQSSFVNWTYPEALDTLVMNQTDNVVTVSWGTEEYLGLDSTVYCGQIELQPYTSAILIKTGITCPNAELDEPSVLPSLQVYPNPTSGNIRIKGECESYVIIDGFGKNVLSGDISTDELIPTAALDPGVYLLIPDGNPDRCVRWIKY